MSTEPTPLNQGFGVLINDVTPQDLVTPAFQRRARELWVAHRGLMAVRGPALAALEPNALVAWSEIFGRVEHEPLAGRDDAMVAGHPITRIGNVRDTDGKARAVFAKVPALRGEDDVRYNTQTRCPVWHTDSTFKSHPPSARCSIAALLPRWRRDPVCRYAWRLCSAR
jgi:alpha-ketoglutarate-dependent taurine dioxygenase